MAKGQQWLNFQIKSIFTFNDTGPDTHRFDQQMNYKCINRFEFCLSLYPLLILTRTPFKKHININFLNTYLHKFPYNLYYWLGVLLKLRKYIYKKNAKHLNLYIINIFIYSMCVMCLNLSYPKDIRLIYDQWSKKC